MHIVYSGSQYSFTVREYKFTAGPHCAVNVVYSWYKYSLYITSTNPIHIYYKDLYTCGMLSVEKERRSKIDSQTVNEKRQGIDCNQYFVYFSVGKKIK